MTKRGVEVVGGLTVPKKRATIRDEERGELGWAAKRDEEVTGRARTREEGGGSERGGKMGAVE